MIFAVYLLTKVITYQFRGQPVWLACWAFYKAEVKIENEK